MNASAFFVVRTVSLEVLRILCALCPGMVLFWSGLFAVRALFRVRGLGRVLLVLPGLYGSGICAKKIKIVHILRVLHGFGALFARNFANRARKDLLFVLLSLKRAQSTLNLGFF